MKPEEVAAIGEALEQKGIAIVEVPLNSPRPMESIALLARAFGDRLLIGAGTVMTTAQVAHIAAAGGRLVVTPHADAAIVRAAKQQGLLAVPGFFTPGRGIRHAGGRCRCVEVVPGRGCEPGGAACACGRCLPAGTAVLPVGGIDASNMAAWREAGAAGFGIGSAIYRPGDSPETVAAKAQRLVSALRKS